MSKRPFIYGLLAGIPLGWLSIPLAIMLFTAIVSPFFEGDRQMSGGYRKVMIGMTKAEVASLMGSPGKQSEKFYLGQEKGFEFEYALAGRVGAAYYLSWVCGIDTVMTVAFDREDRVSIRPPVRRDARSPPVSFLGQISRD